MIQSRTVLKGWFSDGQTPTGSQFSDWLDSFFHQTEDPNLFGNVNYSTTNQLSSSVGTVVSNIPISALTQESGTTRDPRIGDFVWDSKDIVGVITDVNTTPTPNTFSIKTLIVISWDSLEGKPTSIVIDASYVHTDNNFTTTLKDKLTAVPSAFATVATSGDYTDLSGTPTLGTMAGESKSDYPKTADLATVATSGKYTDLTDTPDFGTMAAESASDYTKTTGLATVATSGDYTDLSNTPSIPSKTSDLTNDSNFVADASYVHTDNNYTTDEKNALSTLSSSKFVADQAADANSILIKKVDGTKASTHDLEKEQQSLTVTDGVDTTIVKITPTSFTKNGDEVLVDADVTNKANKYTDTASKTWDISDLYSELLTKQQTITSDKSIVLDSTSVTGQTKLSVDLKEPTTTLDYGYAADARYVANQIAAASKITGNRGSVVSAYTPIQVYALDPITINNPGSGYHVGDSLQHGFDLKDALLVVSTIDTNGEILTFSISSKGANSTDPGALTNEPFVGGHGSGATFDAVIVQEPGTVLSDIPNPKPNDMVRVILDETHKINNNPVAYDWIYADTNGDDIYNWISLAPAGKERDFVTNPISSSELGSGSVITTAIADGAVTSGKLASAISTLLGYIDVNSSISTLLGAKVDSTTYTSDKATFELSSNKTKTITTNPSSASDTLYPTEKAVSTALSTKVSTVDGKGLSTNDYTTAEQTKVSYIDTTGSISTALADKVDKNKSTGPTLYGNTVGLTEKSYDVVTSLTGSSTDDQIPTAKTLYTALGKKVDTVTGKGLSTNDYTVADQTKVGYIDTGGSIATLLNSKLEKTFCTKAQLDQWVLAGTIVENMLYITTDE